jgi:hypothetical protein
VLSEGSHRLTDLDKLPKTKEEIAQLIIAELRCFDCTDVLAVVIVPIDDHPDHRPDAAATWTVSCFNVGKSGGWACDRALQHIVPRFQQLYDLVQKH